nr:hypothetical protein [Tanacetum cinerariifolium]
MMGYHFSNLHENKVSVARRAESFENSLKCTKSVWESHIANSEWKTANFGAVNSGATSSRAANPGAASSEAASPVPTLKLYTILLSFYKIQVLQFSLQSFISLPVTQQSQAEFPQLDSGLAVPTFQKGEDPIDCINKAMAFLSVIVSRFPPSNNQIRTSSNPRYQATIQDGRVRVQQVQGRQTQSFAGTGNKGISM